MTLNAIASTALVIGYIFCALVTAIALGAIAFALTKLNGKIEELTAKLDPLLTKVDDTLSMVNDKVASIGDKAEGILAQGEETAESVHHKVDMTATAVQRTIHAPIIGINSLMAGVSRGVETFGKLQRTAPEAGADGAEAQAQGNNGHRRAESVAALAGKETLDGG